MAQRAVQGLGGGVGPGAWLDGARGAGRVAARGLEVELAGAAGGLGDPVDAARRLSGGQSAAGDPEAGGAGRGAIGAVRGGSGRGGQGARRGSTPRSRLREGPPDGLHLGW